MVALWSPFSGLSLSLSGCLGLRFPVLWQKSGALLTPPSWTLPQTEPASGDRKVPALPLPSRRVGPTLWTTSPLTGEEGPPPKKVPVRPAAVTAACVEVGLPRGPKPANRASPPIPLLSLPEPPGAGGGQLRHTEGRPGNSPPGWGVPSWSPCPRPFPLCLQRPWCLPHHLLSAGALAGRGQVGRVTPSHPKRGPRRRERKRPQTYMSPWPRLGSSSCLATFGFSLPKCVYTHSVFWTAGA